MDGGKKTKLNKAIEGVYLSRNDILNDEYINDYNKTRDKKIIISDFIEEKTDESKNSIAKNSSDAYSKYGKYIFKIFRHHERIHYTYGNSYFPFYSTLSHAKYIDMLHRCDNLLTKNICPGCRIYIHDRTVIIIGNFAVLCRTCFHFQAEII